ncbi:MAG: acetyl-CoA carboxylase biotin carboxylase subunit [Gammaproteobacteria bacterium]|nr:acetyl-CoA carboxylase biotin carboxylase subunit [Gammaproteobacteria bacterium]
MLESVLIANRGEIALRIVRACRELGVRSIAVYSEADRGAPHVLAADEAYGIGPAPSGESYLRTDRLLEVAARSGARAVHPGYGFLSERAVFARAVRDAGLVFIGPKPDTIAAMGDKVRARRLMQEAGTPVIPGSPGPVRNPDEARRQAREIGFPVLLKAAAGGGGKGMRVVEGPEGLERALAAAGREAEAAFGDPAVYLERYLDAPRHIEVQVLGDGHGNLVHLGERECSIQRRHQKLVEESPSPVATPELRTRMGEAAARAARAVGYVGAGTVEFLYLDADFHFLEMNTRLQVEHPVTELVTGIDLVEWQLRVAAGEPLSFTQEDVRLSGHAVECRITSEDPFQGFLPATGRVEVLEVPVGAGVRWDGGIRAGFDIGRHYDPLLGKLVTWGLDRASAVRRMARALDELTIVGVPTSVPFHQRVMRHAAFRRGDLSIRFIEDHPELTAGDVDADTLAVVAAAAALLADGERGRQPARGRRAAVPPVFSAWRRAGAKWAVLP